MYKSIINSFTNLFTNRHELTEELCLAKKQLNAVNTRLREAYALQRALVLQQTHAIDSVTLKPTMTQEQEESLIKLDKFIETVNTVDTEKDNVSIIEGAVIQCNKYLMGYTTLLASLEVSTVHSNTF